MDVIWEIMLVWNCLYFYEAKLLTQKKICLSKPCKWNQHLKDIINKMNISIWHNIDIWHTSSCKITKIHHIKQSRNDWKIIPWYILNVHLYSLHGSNGNHYTWLIANPAMDKVRYDKTATFSVDSFFSHNGIATTELHFRKSRCNKRGILCGWNRLRSVLILEWVWNHGWGMAIQMSTIGWI